MDDAVTSAQSETSITEATTGSENLTKSNCIPQSVVYKTSIIDKVTDVTDALNVYPLALRALEFTDI